MLQTSRLRLDPLVPSDAPAFFTYRAHPEVLRFQNFEPTTLQDAQEFIRRQPASFGLDGTWFQLAIRWEDQLIGDLGLHFVDSQQVEVGITITPTHQGRGFATEALQGMLCHLFGPMKRHRVSASVDPENTASLALMKRAGFRREGHLRQSLWFKGRWADDILFGLLASDFTH